MGGDPNPPSCYRRVQLRPERGGDLPRVTQQVHYKAGTSRMSWLLGLPTPTHRNRTPRHQARKCRGPAPGSPRPVRAGESHLLPHLLLAGPWPAPACVALVPLP